MVRPSRRGAEGVNSMLLAQPMTHPLEVSAAYIVISVIVAWYLGRPRSRSNTTGPGSEFPMAFWMKILASMVFLGIPTILIFSLPEAVHPRAALAMTFIISVLCLSGLIALFTTKIEITTHGFKARCLWMVAEYRFEEFSSVELFRFGYSLKRKDGRLNVGVSVFHSNSADLLDYIKRSIESRS